MVRAFDGEVRGPWFDPTDFLRFSVPLVKGGCEKQRIFVFLINSEPAHAGINEISCAAGGQFF